MSLFESDLFQWRETYFVLFDEENRPQANDVAAALRDMDDRYEIQNVRESEDGRLESLTLFAPADFAAMDISYLTGEDVLAQVEEFTNDLNRADLTDDERAKLDQVMTYSSRFDVYHFEQLSFEAGEDDDEFLDPGSLLVVLERLAGLCKGVGIDPQSGTIM